MSILKHVALALLVSALLAPQTQAVVTITANDGVIQNIPDINTFETWGGPPEAFNMEGMEVTAHFASGASETATWPGVAPQPGGAAQGTIGNWSLGNLTQVTHTFGSPWKLSYAGSAEGNLIGFSIDGFAEFANTGNPGDAVAFDRTLPSAGTGGSASGRDFQTSATANLDVHYLDAIDSLADGQPLQRDLYRRLDARFKESIVPKWQQLPEDQVGENIHSDIDWRRSMQTPDRQAVADDFISDGRPIVGVRWWGSYFNPEDHPKQDADSQSFVPQVEDGFLISFFDNDPAGSALPADLAGSYIAPAENVKITPTDMIGWDGHRVWEYEVELPNTFLDHAGPLATDDSFDELANTEYWLSIAAEDGHRIDPETGKAVDTGDPERTAPFWGWHTSPEHVDNPLFGDDAPVASNVFMPGDDWDYVAWDQVPQFHMDPNARPNNMAFELLTLDPDSVGLDGVLTSEFTFFQDTDIAQAVPEPTTLACLLMGLVGIATGRRRETT
ncbi:MAG: PEP-CTERM sorting domain-containing protein [Pirellulales bacterium]